MKSREWAMLLIIILLLVTNKPQPYTQDSWLVSLAKVISGVLRFESPPSSVPTDDLYESLPAKIVNAPKERVMAADGYVALDHGDGW